ncbi:MAG: YbhB/YbcL family Raf kinase inhibitor-like protein [Thermoplasmata archaeon]
MSALKLESPAFENGKKIPRKYGYKKKNINPPLNIKGVSDGTKSLALIMDDPDAMAPAGKVWDHWVIWNISPNTKKIKEGSVPKEAVEGKSDYGEIGYGGPAPPDKEHTYVFKLYALDNTLPLKKGATKDKLKKAMKGHVLAKSVLKGTYAP